jgi:hypothetical protein
VRRLAASTSLALVALLLAAGVAQAQGSIAINPRSNLPPEVDSGRFAALAAGVARGWRIRVSGESERVAGRHDGANVLGFTSDLPAGVLGSYDAWGQRVYVRRCRRTASGRRCRRVPRERITEADVSINAAFRWNPGPRYPTAEEVDLESVMIHEVGHFAAPRAPHRHGCANSPLVESLSSGEWWRGPNDWFRVGCPNSPRRPAAGARAARARGAGAREYGFRVVRHGELTPVGALHSR